MPTSRLVRGVALAAAVLVPLAPRVAHAGAVYVPLPGVTAVGSATWEPQVLLSNDLANTARNAVATLVPAEADGTKRDNLTGTNVRVGAQRLIVFRPTANAAGLLELNGATELQYAARLAGGPDGLGVALPVIGSGDLAPAGGKMVVQGLGGLSNGTRGSVVGIVNLGQQATSCTVSVTGSAGNAVLSTATVSLQPVTHRLFTVGTGLTLADVRASVSCDKAFYAWGYVTDTASGAFKVLWPASSGSSTLVPPGSGPSCGSGITCFDAAGTVHRPTASNPVGRVTFAVPPMTAERIKLEMDVTVGPFYSKDPGGKHLIYWFVINNNKDMPGMLYFRGSSRAEALVRHGIHQTHPEKAKIEDKSFDPQVGTTYHVVNDYDMGSGSYKVTITEKDTGIVRSQLVGHPNVGSYTFKSGDHFLIDMGFKENNIPDEVPSYNWTYANIHVELTP